MKTKQIKHIFASEMKITLPKELRQYVKSHEELRNQLGKSKVNLSDVVVHARHNGK